MFFDIQALAIHPVEFKEEIQPDALDLGTDIRQLTPLKTTGRAELVEEHHGKHRIIKDIRLRGELQTSLELICARCLEPVNQDVKRSFELLYRPVGVDAGRDELSVTDAEAEIGYYQGEGLLLEDVLREQVLLAIPLKITCREDCRGLCPQCGTNLNQQQCSCQTTMPDPRWAVLGEIRNRLN
ncbi:MAG TPA: DUF177 domain-containing protein [Candidatus Sulfotelmatobacter sp.]